MPANAHSFFRLFSYQAACALCLAIVLTVGGAFDTDDIGLAHRLTLWSVVSGLIVGQVSLLHALFVRLVPRGAGYQGIAALLAVFMTVVLMTFELHGLKFTPLLPKQPDPLLEFALFVMPAVSAVGGLVLLLRLPIVRHRLHVDRFQNQRNDDPRPASRIESGDGPPSLDARKAGLEDWPDGPVLRVGAQDHYLEVVTAHGSVLIRGRMRDALMKLKDADGVQAHRSWWVASAEIAEVRRQARDYVLVLRDRTEIPVGRQRIRHLRAKGLL